MINKKFMILSLVTIASPLIPVLGEPATATEMPAPGVDMVKELPSDAKMTTKDRKANLKKMKGKDLEETKDTNLEGMQGANLSDKDKKTIKAQSKGRTVQKVGGKIVSASDNISGYLASSNFLTNTINLIDSVSPVSFINPLIVAGLLNNIVAVIGQGVEAYGGYLQNGAFANMAADIALGKLIDLNDINEATKSLEKIDALQEIEKNLSGQKTIKRALEKEGPNVSTGKKLFIHLNPLNLKNTIKRYTDDLHITNNQQNTGEKLANIRKQREEEEKNFDSITNRLQLRFLNRMRLALLDALDKVEKIKNPKPFHPALVKQKPELADKLDKLDLNQYRSQLQSEIKNEKAKRLLLKEKNPKKLKNLQSKQDIDINKLEARLTMFEKTLGDTPAAERELKELEEKMAALKSKTTEPTVNEDSKQIKDQVGEMTEKLKALETLKDQVGKMAEKLKDLEEKLATIQPQR